MFDHGDWEKSLKPPFSAEGLEEKAARYWQSFERLTGKNREPTIEELNSAYGKIEEWLSVPDKQNRIAILIDETVAGLKDNEPSIFSESHDLFHVSEMITCLLDDRARGVDTSNTVIFLTVAIGLLHDLGRSTEKQLTSGQIDLSTPLHHDVFSYRAARKILARISDEWQLPADIKEAYSKLLFYGLLHYGQTNHPDFLAVAYDADRRQLLGSPTVARDILYFGGMEKKDLTCQSILNMPPGYTHYDSGGFFGQQNTMARNVFRDESIRQSRKLDQVYDGLATEAIVIMLLACDGDRELLERAFDVDLALIETPAKGLTDAQGQPWWPKKLLPSEQILPEARLHTQAVKAIITDRELTAEQVYNLVSTFLNAYSTIIDSGHLEVIRNNIYQFDQSDRLKWARILYYSHKQNQERIIKRQEVLDNLPNGDFLKQLSTPFQAVLNRTRQTNQLDNQFRQFWPKS